MSEVELSKYLWRSTENAFELLKRRVDGTQELPSKQALYQLKVRGTRQIQNSIPYDDPCAYFDVQKLLDEALFGKHSYESDNTSIVSRPHGTTDHQSEDASSDFSSDCSHATDDEFPSSPRSMTESTLNACTMSNMSLVADPDVPAQCQQEVVADVIPHDATASAEADDASVPTASVLSTVVINELGAAADAHCSLVSSATADQAPLTTGTGLETAATGGEDTAQDPHVPTILPQDPAERAAPVDANLSSFQQPHPLSSQRSQQGAPPLSSPQPVRVWGVYSQEEINFIQRTREEYRLAGKKLSACGIYIAEQLGRSERSVETRVRSLVRAEQQKCQPTYLPILAPTAHASSLSPPPLLTPPAPLLLVENVVQGSTACDQPSILPGGDNVSLLNARRAEQDKLPPPSETVQGVPAGDPRTRHQLPEESEEAVVPLSVLGNFSLEEVNYMLHAREVFGRAGRKHPSLVAFLSKRLCRPTRTIEYKLNALRVNLRLPDYFDLYVRPVYHSPAPMQSLQAQETAYAGQQRASDHRNIRSAVPPTPTIPDAVSIGLGGVKRTLSDVEADTRTVTEVTERAAPTFTAEEVNVIQIATDVHMRRGSSLDECLQFLVARLSRPCDDILAQIRSMNCAAASAAWEADPAWAAAVAPRPPVLAAAAAADRRTKAVEASAHATAGVRIGQGLRRVVALPTKKRFIPTTKWTYVQAPSAAFGVGQRSLAVPYQGVSASGQSTSSESDAINPFALLNRIWQGECPERVSPHPADAHPPETAVDNSAIPAECESAATCSAVP